MKNTKKLRPIDASAKEKESAKCIQSVVIGLAYWMRAVKKRQFPFLKPLGGNVSWTEVIEDELKDMTPLEQIAIYNLVVTMNLMKQKTQEEDKAPQS